MRPCEMNQVSSLCKQSAEWHFRIVLAQFRTIPIYFRNNVGNGMASSQWELPIKISRFRCAGRSQADIHTIFFISKKECSTCHLDRFELMITMIFFMVCLKHKPVGLTTWARDGNQNTKTWGGQELNKIHTRSGVVTS